LECGTKAFGTSLAFVVGEEISDEIRLDVVAQAQ
jgi:hypothetical protein